MRDDLVGVEHGPRDHLARTAPGRAVELHVPPARPHLVEGGVVQGGLGAVATGPRLQVEMARLDWVFEIGPRFHKAVDDLLVERFAVVPAEEGSG